MVAKYVSALKAMFTLYGLKYNLLVDPKVKYFIRSMRFIRSLFAVQEKYHVIGGIEKLAL